MLLINITKIIIINLLEVFLVKKKKKCPERFCTTEANRREISSYTRD